MFGNINDVKGKKESDKIRIGFVWDVEMELSKVNIDGIYLIVLGMDDNGVMLGVIMLVIDNNRDLSLMENEGLSQIVIIIIG